MSSDDEQHDTNSDDPLQTLRDVVAAVQAEDDPATVIRLYKTVDRKTYPASVQDALEKLYAQSLLRNGQYSEARDFLPKLVPSNNDEDGWCHELQAYALYKQKEYQQVISLLSNKSKPKGDSVSMQYLLAQSLYHVSDTASATALYQHQILGNNNNKDDNRLTDDEDKVQIYTNLVTAHFANATPYCKSRTTTTKSAGTTTTKTTTTKKLVDDAMAFLQQQKFNSNNGNDYPYDLAYSLASWQLVTTPTAADRAPWRQLLQQATTACLRLNSTTANASDELASASAIAELGPLRTNQALLEERGGMFWNPFNNNNNNLELLVGSTKAAAEKQQLPAAVQSVRRVNAAIFLGSSSTESALTVLQDEEPDANWTPLQKRLWYYNRAVVQLRANQRDECRRTCHYLQTHVLRNNNNKKKKGPDPLAVHDDDPEAQLWWEARVLVLLAYCNVQDEKAKSSAVPLYECIAKCQALPASSGNVRDSTLVYLLTHRAAVAAAAAAANGNGSASAAMNDLKLLETISESLSSSSSPKPPAVAATMATLYYHAGNERKAVELLESVDNGGGCALADFFMALGNYEKAASLYEAAVVANDGTNVSTAQKAQWVRALSYTDPERAAQVWAETRPDLEDDEHADQVNGAELEAQELPRNLLKSQTTTTRRIIADSLAASSSEKETTKKHTAILRRRARTREAYLAKKEAAGALRQPAGKPDPERWIPKYERSTARRRRHHHHHGRGGGQQPHKGAQGGVSETEAAKLDVVARQAARAAGEVDSRSTAHMTVSGGARFKSGKRR